MVDDIEKFRERLRNSLKRNREAFEGTYKSEINSLLGFSREEIDKITPGTTDLEVYDQLISVVKEASRLNISQAELKSQIKELGSIAVEIAKRVEPLGNLLI